jgi:flagellar basal-body rod protein FlgB
MTEAIQTAIHVALNGLADRQKVSANNIANIQTPGYLAGQTDFENSLASALKGQTTNVTPTRLTSQAPTNVNGNNVDLDNETVTAMDTELRYQAMISAMNSKFRILKTAMG